MTKRWKWESWEALCDGGVIEDPIEYDHYNIPHVIRPGVVIKFKTILQYIFSTTVIDRIFPRNCCADQQIWKERY